MLICVYTSASVTVSFIIIPWIQNYECGELIQDSASTVTSRFCLWSKQVELLLSLHAKRAHKYFVIVAQSTG